MSLRDTKIGGGLELSGAKLLHKGEGLTAEFCEVHGEVRLNNGFRSKGEISFRGAKIGSMNCSRGAVQKNLNLQMIEIRGHLLLSDEFKCFGAVNLLQANIGGQVNCQWSFIHIMLAENARIGGNLLWRGIRHPEKCHLNLVRATVNTIYDQRESWPPPQALRLNGLVAQGLQLYKAPLQPVNRSQPFTNRSLPLRASDRIHWLQLQPTEELIEAQPWMHVAQMLEQNGRKRDARRVLREMRRHQGRANWAHRRFKALGIWWEGMVAALEEQPFRIVYPILICIALGGVVFTIGKSQFTPIKAPPVSGTQLNASPLRAILRFFP